MFIHRNQNCIEEPVTIATDNYELYGMLYRGEGTSRAMIIICAPDGDERYWSQRLLVNTARLLAEQGFIVLRFDYMGQGESPGNYESATIYTRMQDLNKVLEYMTRQNEGCPLGLLGVRLSAALAIKTANLESHKVDFLVLWEPVLDIDHYFDSQLRIHTTTQMVMYKKVLRNRDQLKLDIMNGEKVSINGYNLARDFYKEALELTPKKDLERYQGKVLSIVNKRVSSQLQESERLPPIKYPAFWRENKFYWEFPHALLDTTMDWFQRNQL